MNDVADFTLEVRNRSFTRVGQIAPEYTDLKFVDVHNGVGSWELRLPAEHPLLPDLKTKGAGIVLTEHWMEGPTHKYRTYSGRMRTARLSQGGEDPAGTWIISGVDDNVLAAATRVYPDPANLASAQTAAYWEQSGNAETVMKLAVQVNIGSAAIASRKYAWLTLAANLTRGPSVKCSSRFDILGELLTSLGAAANLGWEFRQVGNGVAFDVYTPADKTGEVRLDIRNGGIESNELGFTAPSATDVLVMGQGEGAARQIIKVTSTAADAEAVDWALRWETTKDPRQTDDPAELTQAGVELLTEAGSTVNSLKVVPSDSPGMALGRNWYRGDRITVVVEGQETTAIVTQVAVSISSAGVLRQATIGDPTGFDFDAKIASKIKEQEKRIGQVERLIGQGVDYSDISNLPAAFPSTWALISGGNHGRGTTAQRNTQFGTPANDATRAALANREVTWFNTDLGWEESYYATTGLSGLTALGLVTGAAHGWYPTGAGAAPAAVLVPSAAQTLTTGVWFTNWAAFGTGNSRRRGGTAWWGVTAGSLVPKVAGNYRPTAQLNVQAGGGTAIISLLKNGSTALNDTLLSPWFTLSSTVNTMIPMNAPDLILLANEGIGIYATSVGSASFGVGGNNISRLPGHLGLTYISPPLASD